MIWWTIIHFFAVLFCILYVRSTPHPVTVTTRIVTFSVGNPYKPSFATVTGWGVDPNYTCSSRFFPLEALILSMGILNQVACPNPSKTLRGTGEILSGVSCFV